jgi:putative peptidoglycan lipid II flippase
MVFLAISQIGFFEENESNKLNLRSLISAGGIVVVGMMAGRALGLLREISIAAYFGINGQSDVAILLLIIPDFITAVFIGSAASAALIPAFALREKPQAIALFWQTMAISVVGFSLLAILCIVLGNWFTIADYIILLLTFFSLPFMGATAVCAAWLQYSERFVVPAFATVIFNVVILCALWLVTGDLKILAVGIFFASLLRFFVHMRAFFCSLPLREGEAGLFRCVRNDIAWQINKKLAVTYLQTTTAGVLGMLPIYAPYLILSATVGGLSLFNYAFKLVLLPTMLLQTIIQTVILPLLVKQHPELRSKTHILGLQIGLICGVAIALFVTFTAHVIANLCFAYGKISAQNVDEIAGLLRLGIWSTPFAILSCLWQQMLYAENRAKTAMFASFVEAALLFPLYYFGLKIWGVSGVMVGYLAIRIGHLLFIIQLVKGKKCSNLC